ncbi:MAG: hypothetical protein IIA45_04440 [Bacteroidetes bacterium]|nr:hypothetical protein [Bacteroidota bacterium]
MTVLWKKLKNNAQGKGFELLALEYLNSNFPNDWIATKQTRDGNKDAYTIVFLDKEIWAEAKFTKKRKLPRYRLDATIVSALIKDNVIELIFLTNSEINEGAKHDIERALRNAMHDRFNEVHFKTKLDLEYWLYCNPEKYEKFFEDSKESLLETEFDQLFVINDISIFKRTRITIGFREPLNSLYSNSEYTLSFSIFSPTETSLQLSTISDLISIDIDKVALQKGVNHLNIEMRTLDSGKLGREVIALENDLTVLLKQKTLIKLGSPDLYIGSQEAINRDLSASLVKFIDGQNTESQVHTITGSSGIGKSTLVETVLNSGEFINKDIIYVTFTEDDDDNKLQLLHIILSILFYYTDQLSIDSRYLLELQQHGTFISSFLIDMIRQKEDFQKNKSKRNVEVFNRTFAQYDSTRQLFPSTLSINEKILVFDDLQKLTENCRGFLCQMISDLNQTEVRTFVLFCGRYSFFESTEYLHLLRTTEVTNYEFELTFKDVKKSLARNEIDIDLSILENFLDGVRVDNFLIVSLISFFQTHKEILDKGGFENFAFLTRLFVTQGMHNETLRKMFSEIKGIENDVLGLIYFSYSGIDPQELPAEHSKILDSLESKDLIKYASFQKVIPYHDIYTDFYREHFLPPNNETINKYLLTKLSKYERYRFSLVNGRAEDQISINDIVREIQTLHTEQKFFVVLYILDQIFGVHVRRTRHTQEKHKNRLQEELYYQLYFFYAYAAANCNRNGGGKELFHMIYQETISLRNSHIKEITVSSLAELINSSFEHLETDNVRSYSKILVELLDKLASEGYLENPDINGHPSYILMLEVNFLLELMLDNQKQAQEYYKELDLCCNKVDPSRKNIIDLRYARSLYHHNLDLATKLVKRVLKRSSSTDNQKLKLLAGFELKFLDVLCGRGTLKNLLKAHQLLKKHYYNDYRKGELLIAAYYLTQNNPKRTLEILSSDVLVKRGIRPRLEGFRFQLLSAAELLNKNRDKSEQYLKKQKELFANLGSSYTEIIDHNTHLVHNDARIESVKFSTSGNFNPNTFYLDPRMW